MDMFDQPVEPMSPYDALTNQNFIRRFAPMFNNGFFKFSSDTGKLVMPPRFTYLKLPWLLSNTIPGKRCGWQPGKTGRLAPGRRYCRDRLPHSLVAILSGWWLGKPAPGG